MPFQGQKRKFIKDFKTALKDFPSDAVYVDLFGGSGLLSHTVKQVYPNTKVVWNDFDNFDNRLANIDQTNAILSDIREILKDSHKDKKVDNQLKEKILERIKQEQGFVDYITISSSVLFSAKYMTDFESLSKETFYNNVKLSNYNADGYLQGVERVQMDYKALFELYKEVENVVFLIDPPYLSTDTSTYSRMDYWRLGDYLDILNMLDNRSYFYFTSNKSQVVELAYWMGENGFKKNPFADATTIEINTSLNHTAKYTDIMIYKSV